MLQWMGGSRKKVASSRKSIQKRQKQYFEQRKRKTNGLDTYDDETNKTEKHPKERRSLDVTSLLNLSKISQEFRPTCPSGRNDLGVTSSKVQFDASSGSLPVQSGTIVQPFDSKQVREAGIPSAFQVKTASPKNHRNDFVSHNGHTTKSDQWVTMNEQPLSVLDLLADDGLNTDMEGNTKYEDHVAFSVQGIHTSGLGRVGAQTPDHSPQCPNRAFGNSFSSPKKPPGKLNLSKKFDSLLDDLDSEGARMQEINIPINSNHLDFSSDYMDLLSNPKQKSFTLRDARQYDSCRSKKHCYFDQQSEDKWEDRSRLEHDSFFDEASHDLSWKTRKRPMKDILADNVVYRSYDTPDFSFESPQISTRAAEKVTDKFDILGSTSPFSKHNSSEYGRDFLVSNWSRQPTVERKFDHAYVTNKPEHFTAVKEEARENSSLQSEESCSSTAVKYQAADDSISNATSRYCRRRRNETVFASSIDKENMKAFTKESKNDCEPEITAARTNMLDSSDLKLHRHSNSFFQENLEPNGNWFSEERFTEVDINPPRSRSKNLGFDSDLWDEDPFCKSPAPKSQMGADRQRSGFHYEPVANSPSGYFAPEKIPVQDNSPMWSKPELPPDSRFTAGCQSGTLSHDISAQESIEKDVESKVKIKPSSGKNSHPGEEICVGNESAVSEAKVATEASNSTCNDHEAKEQKDQTLTTAFSPDPEEDILLSAKINPKSGTRDHHPAYRSPHSYRIGEQEKEKYFAPKERMGYKQKSDYFDSPGQAMILQSYVFQLFCVQKRLHH